MTHDQAPNQPSHFPRNRHSHYHAHVYFDRGSLAQATKLCYEAGKTFGLTVGSLHQKPVGPHLKWSCQILFKSSDFDALMPWLDDRRAALSILIHADTGNDLKDHTDYAYWLGQPQPLNLAMFMR